MEIKSPEAVRSGMQNMKIHIADKVSYTVKAAKTAEELRTGLMNVRNLSDNAGMLFDLRQYPGASMWMKNTYIPLDMLFIGCDWKVVDIYENAKPLFPSQNRQFKAVLLCFGNQRRKCLGCGNCNGR